MQFCIGNLHRFKKVAISLVMVMRERVPSGP